MPDDPIEPANSSADDDPTLRSPAAEEDAVLGTGPAAVPAEKRAVVIGRYKLIKELGKGGFGIVWQAEQTEPIRREVALKIIKPGMDSREIIARFEAERQALALMDHPNIAAVLDAGTTARGQPYFVMELVKGVPITDYCDAHLLGIRERLELFIPVCQAVQHAHQKAILHRDLKPSNILVTEVDGKPVPKVIDFGIAKAVSAPREEMLGASLTREGMVVGTPQYMSPEQAGSMPDVDTRSDIYTLGVILYELLIGQAPLSRETLRQAAFDELLRLIREGEIKRPSSRLVPVTEAVNLVARQRNGSRILSATLDAARVWDAQNGKLLFELPFAEPLKRRPPLKKEQFSINILEGTTITSDSLVMAQFSPDGKRIVTASEWGCIGVWDAQNGKWLSDTYSDGTKGQSLRLSPDASRIATSSGDKVQVWDVQSGKPLTKPMKHGERVVAADFSPDGNRIITVCFGGKAQMWDVRSGKPLNEPIKRGGGIVSAEFSPDGKRIVTACEDGTAWVWDVQSGKLLTEQLEENELLGGHVMSARFSPDGKWVVTASMDATVRIWRIAPPGSRVPEWLARLAEAVADEHLNDSGAFEPPKEDSFRVLAEVRAELSRAPADDEWAAWGRWFLADRCTRTISASSKITVPENVERLAVWNADLLKSIKNAQVQREHIENLIKENTPKSLDEAERLAVGNAELLKRITSARAQLKTPEGPAQR